MWTDKYKPDNLDEFVGNKKSVNKSIEKLKDVNNLLITGPTGIGKKLLVELISKELNLKITEISYDFKDKKEIYKFIENNKKSPSFTGSKKLILVNDIEKDIYSSNLLDKTDNSINPIVLISKENYMDPELKQDFTHIELDKIDNIKIAKYLRKICEKENIEYDFESLRSISDSAEGDIRSAVLKLESVAKKKNSIKNKTFKIKKDATEIQIFDILDKIFKQEDKVSLKTINNINIEPQTLLYWITLNACRLQNIQKKNSYYNLSRSDIYLNRIIKTQNYNYQKYALYLMINGVNINSEFDPDTWINYKTDISKFFKSSKNYPKNNKEKAETNNVSQKTYNQELYKYSKLIKSK